MATKRAQELAQDRARIRRADPIGLLAAIAEGKPLAVRDWEGAVVDYVRPTVDHRVMAARELVKKIVPDLRSVDVTADGGGGLTFVFESPVPLPGSARQSVPGDAAIPQIAQHLQHRIEDAVLADDEGDDDD